MSESSADTNTSSAGPKKVFISYAWEGDDHQVRVVALANRLRDNGLESSLDVFVPGTMPPEGWPNWMLRQVRWADFVLCVCTETYRRRCEGEEAAGTGKGVKWEGSILTQSVYDDDSRNTRFIPVVFDTAQLASIPTLLRGASRYDLSAPDGFERLLRHLLDQREFIPVPIGQPPTLPPRNVPPNFP